MPQDRPLPFAPPRRQAAAPRNSLLWIFEPLERDAGYSSKRMFGCLAAYLDDLLCLVAADRGDPWNGLLVCTSRDRHAALMADEPALRPHAVLGKWLYLPQDHPEFETVAARLARRTLERDPRLGVAPRPRAPRARRSAVG